MRPLARSELAAVLESAADAFEALRGARLFVTGGTGFYGAWLLETLAFAERERRLGIEAVVLTRSAEAARARQPHLGRWAGLRFIEGDIRQFALPEGSFSHVIHAAAASHFAGRAPESPLSTIDVIVNGTRRVLEFARGAGVKRLLLTSSGAVYGRQPPSLPLLPEDFTGGPDCLDPRAAYGHSKRLAEQLCIQHQAEGGPGAVIARGFAFSGAHLPLDAHFAFGNFIADALAGRPIKVRGDGSPLRSYLHASDLAAWLWTLLASGTAGTAYNVGSEAALSIGELAGRIGARLHAPVDWSLRADPRTIPERYIPATRKAREELGLVARVDIDEAIDRTARWHRGEE